MSKPTCETCEWWADEVDDIPTNQVSEPDGTLNCGECRLMPPTHARVKCLGGHKMRSRQYVMTNFDDFCGQHSPKKLEEKT